MDSGLRWSAHLTYLKNKTRVYINVLKWIAGSAWGIGPAEGCRFVNATILAQLEWGSGWYSNAAKTHIKK